MDCRVISADNHVVEPPNTFVDCVPVRLKDIAKLTIGLDEATKHKLLAANAVRIFNLQ